MEVGRISLQNWRNFKEVNVDLQRRVYITGPNASGKSNFLDVFRFLQEIAQPGAHVCRGLRFAFLQEWTQLVPEECRRELAGRPNLQGTLATAQSGVDSNLNGDSAGDRTIVNPSGNPNVGSGVSPLTNSAGQIVAYQVINPSAGYVATPKGSLATGGQQHFDVRADRRHRSFSYQTLHLPGTLQPRIGDSRHEYFQSSAVYRRLFERCWISWRHQH